MIIYDAKGQILGRLSSVVAKRLLGEESVSIVNVEGAVLSGNREATIKLYKQRTKRGDPIKGPFFPKTPDGIFRRAVKGMLPMKKPSGKKAYRRLKAYVGVPEELAGKEAEFQKNVADSSKLMTRSMTIGELSAALHARKQVNE